MPRFTDRTKEIRLQGISFKVCLFLSGNLLNCIDIGAICSDERILRMVKKPKITKNKAKKSERICENCIFFTRSKEGNK